MRPDSCALPTVMVFENKEGGQNPCSAAPSVPSRTFSGGGGAAGQDGPGHFNAVVLRTFLDKPLDQLPSCIEVVPRVATLATNEVEVRALLSIPPTFTLSLS
jgi:hypothetical protein